MILWLGVKGGNILWPTLFGHTNFQFNHQGEKKVDNSGGLCSMEGISEGKERIVAEHPKGKVSRRQDAGRQSVDCVRSFVFARDLEVTESSPSHRNYAWQRVRF